MVCLKYINVEMSSNSNTAKYFKRLHIKISGKTNTYCYDGGSGNKMNILFCPSCATKIYIQPELIDGMIYIPIGLLKEHYEFNPKVEIFSYNKPKCLSNLNVTVESYDHNGTIERISDLLENLEQR